jgi:hypothetical protein
MSNNDGHHDQWLTAGCKKHNNKELGVEQGNKGGSNGVCSTEGDRNQHDQSTKQGRMTDADADVAMTDNIGNGKVIIPNKEIVSLGHCPGSRKIGGR